MLAPQFRRLPRALHRGGASQSEYSASKLRSIAIAFKQHEEPARRVTTCHEATCERLRRKWIPELTDTATLQRSANLLKEVAIGHEPQKTTIGRQYDYEHV